MKLSTKGRYGLRALIDLAQNGGEQPVSITSISTRQDISERYLEQLMSMLKKAGIVRSVRGAGGGYVLVKRLEDISVGDVLRALEGSLEPVDCVAFEDSINGIKSAHAAGMTTVMVPDLLEPTDEIKPMIDFLCTDLSEAIKHL